MKGYKQDRNSREKERDEESEKEGRTKRQRKGKGKRSRELLKSPYRHSTLEAGPHGGRPIGFGSGLPDYWALPARPPHLGPVQWTRALCTHLA